MWCADACLYVHAHMLRILFVSCVCDKKIPRVFFVDVVNACVTMVFLQDGGISRCANESGTTFLPIVDRYGDEGGIFLMSDYGASCYRGVSIVLEGTIVTLTCKPRSGQ